MAPMVVLACSGAALGVAEDDVAAAQVGEHGGGDLAGVGPRGLEVAILGADGHVEAGQRPDHRVQGDERGAEHRLDGPQAAQRPVDRLGQRLGLGQGGVHLPVAGDDRLACAGHGR
jgi:hypothetical protein